MTNPHPLFALQSYINERIIGQEGLTLRLFVAILAEGHLLVEGAPGLAKTRAIKELSSGLASTFRRIQFTPDLLPGDLTGTEIYRPQEGTFHFKQGPIFHNIILADEINRAPAKVQSALLEAMGEQQVTVADETYILPKLFMVMATQNPLEQEGTYPLPEAQLDRFLLHVKIDYPSIEAERAILKLSREDARSLHTAKLPQKVQEADIFSARRAVLDLHLSDALEEYIVQIIAATRDPSAYSEKLSSWIQYGASPRATIALDRCARAHAWLAGRDYVEPEDIHAMIHDVLRHRLILSFEADAAGITTDDFITELVSKIGVP
ncbi:MAG: MoxR family ATPase [Methylococcales bacterium]|jgi:MoxR-like ATPase|nr:MoxR family ATPase [Methylococcales bacterium]MBT7444697.1 MoxR family ATPase [Methylococcales bacterium]